MIDEIGTESLQNLVSQCSTRRALVSRIIGDVRTDSSVRRTGHPRRDNSETNERKGRPGKRLQVQADEQG